MRTWHQQWSGLTSVRVRTIDNSGMMGVGGGLLGRVSCKLGFYNGACRHSPQSCMSTRAFSALPLARLPSRIPSFLVAAVHEARGHTSGGGALGASLAAHRPNAHGGALNRPGGGGKLLPTANNMGRLDTRFNAGQVQLRDDLLDSLGGLSNAAINTVKVAHGSKAAAAATRSKDRADRATGGLRRAARAVGSLAYVLLPEGFTAAEWGRAVPPVWLQPVGLLCQRCHQAPSAGSDLAMTASSGRLPGAHIRTPQIRRQSSPYPTPRVHTPAHSPARTSSPVPGPAPPCRPLPLQWSRSWTPAPAWCCSRCSTAACSPRSTAACQPARRPMCTTPGGPASAHLTAALRLCFLPRRPVRGRGVEIVELGRHPSSVAALSLAQRSGWVASPPQ